MSGDLRDVAAMSRRAMLLRSGAGLGAAALARLLADGDRQPHFTPRARSVIYVHLVGAPSHLDLFSPKPELQRRDGELCPSEFIEGKQLAFIRNHPKLLGTPKDKQFAFRRCGRSGLPISNLLPHLQTCADDLAMVHTVHNEEFNHAPAQMFLGTGFGRFGRPSLGAWASYGLGSANRDLPAYVSMFTGNYPGAGNSIFGSGFLPSVHQGVEFRSKGDPVLFLSDPDGVDRPARRRMVDSVNLLNGLHQEDVGDPEIATRIEQYELAYRMQASVPELMDIASEPAHVHALYGTKPGRSSFANNCLLARRLVERGVRFVQLFEADWDHHGSVFRSLPRKCQQVDRPIAALLTDLRRRGLLDETLVVWASEFGRTPMAQTDNGNGQATKAGRDHHNGAFTLWMAGGGVKGGVSYGETDELGYAAVQDPVHVHDFNATILHLLGLDHERLTYRFQGRDHRLTDVAGRVVRGLLA